MKKIEDVIIKNVDESNLEELTDFNSNLYFKNIDNVGTPWTMPKKHKLVSYQEDNYNKLVKMLQK